MNGELIFPSERRIDAIGQNGGDGGHYDNYSTLRNVLDRAFEQASSGKGQERHGQNLPFDKQPMNSSSTTSPPPTRTAPSSPRPSKPLPGKFPSPSPSEAA